MRAFQGQMSDTKPIQRNAAERAKLLRELETTLSAMKPHVSADLRRSLQTRVSELRIQVKRDAEQSVPRADAVPAVSPTNGRRREVSPEDEARRARRSPRAAHAF